MPYAQWHWPFENQKMVKEQFPADYISEAMDQTRGWFYTLLAISTLLDKGAPYKNVLCYSHVLDEKGQKMSKSKGNVVSPFEVVEQFGADATRWYFYTINSPGDYKLFTKKDVESKLKGFLFTLNNCLRFYELYRHQNLASASEDLNSLDKWIISRLNKLALSMTQSLEGYDIMNAARTIEKFVVDDFSNWWLRRSRKRKEAIGVLRFVLYELAKIIAPFTPFIAEEIYLHVNHLGGSPSSVHLQDWPKVNKKLIDNQLEEEMEQVRSIVTAGLALRKERQLKVRQPLAGVKLKVESGKLQIKEKDLLDLIKEELNVKEVQYVENQGEEIVLDTELTPALVDEGYARELIRQIQDMRKEAGYKFDQEIYGQWHSDDIDLARAVNHWNKEIKQETLLHQFSQAAHDEKSYDVEKEFELVVNKKIWIGIKQ